jgi:4-amino-4-deoxy-L-arabinose transferase-like glycosyltransferase
MVTAELEVERHAREGASTRPSRGSTVFWLVLAGLAVRLCFMLLFSTYLFNGTDDFSSFGEASNIAHSIIEGRGFSSPFRDGYTGPTAWVAPVYPYFLAFAYRCFGVMSSASAIFIFVAQALFSALTVVPILGIASRTVGRRAGYWVAWTWILFPWCSNWSVTWVWEVSLSALLFTLLFWCALCLPETSTRKEWIGFGAFWGFALLVNPALGTLLPVSLAWWSYNLHACKKEWLKPVLLSLLTCGVVISPWLIRNRAAFGRWVFLRSNFGVEFALGNFHSSLGFAEGGTHPTFSQKEYASYKRMGEIAYVQSKQKLGFQFVRDYPWEFTTLTGNRIAHFWDGSAMLYHVPVAWYWIPSSFAVLSFLLLPALLIAHRGNLHGWQMFFGAVLLYPLPYYLTFSHVRYRHAIEPLLLLLIVYSGIEAANKFASFVSPRLTGGRRRFVRPEA